MQAHELTKQIVMLNAVKYLFKLCPFIRDISLPSAGRCYYIKGMKAHEFIKQTVMLVNPISIDQKNQDDLRSPLTPFKTTKPIR